MSKKFNVWKSDSTGEPIVGTDKIMSAPTKRWLMKHIAYEEKVNILPNALIVRLNDGTVWNASEI